MQRAGIAVNGNVVLFYRKHGADYKAILREFSLLLGAVFQLLRFGVPFFARRSGYMVADGFGAFTVHAICDRLRDAILR
jgi:hypothetical protein